MKDYKVKDITLAAFGRKEIEDSRKRDAGIDGIARQIWCGKAFERSSHYGLTSYDHSNGGAD